MAEKYYDPLSDMGRIKETLMSLFFDTEDITKLIMPELDNPNFTWEQNWYGGTFDTTPLIGHCFDIPYLKGMITDNRCAIFIETNLMRVGNQHLKEVGVDICVICHKDSVGLSPEEKAYYNSIGIYGNRVDCAIQAINSSILHHQMMDTIKEKYSIGVMNLIEENPMKQYTDESEFYGKCLSYTYQTFYQRKNNVK